MPWPFSLCCSSNSAHFYSDAAPTENSKPKVQASSNNVKAPTAKFEPYTPARAESLFAHYADEDQPDVIGAEGFERLFTEANISLEGSLPMILSWQLDAKEMFKLTKEEWLKGMASLKICHPSQISIMLNELEDLLILRKPPIKRPPTATSNPYERTSYWLYAADTDAAFQKLYSYCFTLAKPPQSRNIEMETSTAFWTVLLVPKYPIMSEVLRFIAEKEGQYKATNKDLWSMMLEFCKTVKPSLQDYEADGAWPTLLDDFVAWKQEGKGEKEKTEEDA